jgi:ABC-type sugar transport system substrate-binding protein
VRIVVALTTRDSGFQRLQATEARSVATSHGLEVELVSGEGYAIEQIHQLFQFIHAPEAERPTAMIVEAVSEDGMARLARNAVRVGIGWISLNRTAWLPELRSELPGHLVASVSADQTEVGRIQGQQIRALLPGGGRVLCITGPSYHAAPQERRAGLEQALRGADVTITYEEGQWSFESGARLVRNWCRLRSSDDLGFDLLACQNDDMAMGAREVLLGAARPGRECSRQVPILGVDGLPHYGRTMVDRGDLAGTVINPTTSGPAVDLVARWIAGESVATDVVLSPMGYPDAPILRPAQLAGAVRQRYSA